MTICIRSRAELLSLRHQGGSSSGAETCAGMLSGLPFSLAIDNKWCLIYIWKPTIEVCCLLPQTPQERPHLLLNSARKGNRHHPATAVSVGTAGWTRQTDTSNPKAPKAGQYLSRSQTPSRRGEEPRTATAAAAWGSRTWRGDATTDILTEKGEEVRACMSMPLEKLRQRIRFC